MFCNFVANEMGCFVMVASFHSVVQITVLDLLICKISLIVWWFSTTNIALFITKKNPFNHFSKLCPFLLIKILIKNSLCALFFLAPTEERILEKKRLWEGRATDFMLNFESDFKSNISGRQYWVRIGMCTYWLLMTLSILVDCAWVQP